LLDVTHNKVSDEAPIKLASVITYNTSLKHLYLHNCSLDDNGILIICDALTQLSSLVSFNINDNYITLKATKMAAAVLFSNTGLNTLPEHSFHMIGEQSTQSHLYVLYTTLL